MKNTKNMINYYFRHPLFSGSFAMIVGSNITNVIAYIYHFIIGRMLGPASYSELSSMLSILTIIFTTFTFLSIVIVKFVSVEGVSAENTFLWFKDKVISFAIITCVLLLFTLPFIASYIKVDIKTVLLIVPITFFAILEVLYRSFLQGQLKFKEVAISFNLDILARLLISVATVYFGFKVFGAVSGILAGAFVGFWYLNSHSKKIVANTKSKKEIKNLRKIVLFAVPVFVTSLSTNFILSADVIMVKHFFSPHDAGIYASLSTLGRVIFYAAGPIGSVMFPIISRNHAAGKKYIHFFGISLFLTAAICIGVTVAYGFLPKFAINSLFGSNFLEGVPYLLWFSLFMAVFTISQLFISFFLSIDKVRITYLSFIAVVIQFVGINIYHNGILEVIKVSTFASSLLLGVLIIYFLYEKSVKNI